MAKTARRQLRGRHLLFGEYLRSWTNLDLGGCYPPRPSTSVNNTLLDLLNSLYPTQPHSLIAKYNIPETNLKCSRFCELYSKTWTVIFVSYMLLYAIERIFLYCSSGVPAELYPFWGQQNSWQQKLINGS